MTGLTVLWEPWTKTTVGDFSYRSVREASNWGSRDIWEFRFERKLLCVKGLRVYLVWCDRWPDFTLVTGCLYVQYLPGTSCVVPAFSTCRCLQSLVAPPCLSQHSYLPVTYAFQYEFPGLWNQGWEQEGFSVAQCFRDCNSVVCRYCQECFLFSLSSSWCFFAAGRWSHKLCLMAGSSPIQNSERVRGVLAWLSQVKVSPLLELIFKSWGESYLF